MRHVFARMLFVHVLSPLQMSWVHVFPSLQLYAVETQLPEEQWSL